MARLTTAQRKRIPKGEYGLPVKAKKGVRGGAPRGAYPMPDVAHARNAKARAQQQYERGNLSRAELLQIERKANRIIKAAGGKPAKPGTGRTRTAQRKKGR